ncbi:hypothetical protein STCU_08565 [Strigomonas culicis]|uniref:RRM domain-containing protein n=1 Tax=Strigomonas culicis TaxID=28005 RepID=S9V3A9_9TRYP|nr:hypothetical protein STCU_08565 [Strigomonas culicis]|eukprot:EPY21396.1 hypothetical protein STCU_08565 [Strigomonas culicis]
MTLPDPVVKPNAAGTIGSPLPPSAAATAGSGSAAGVVMRPYKDDVYYHVYLIYAERDEAETVARFVAKRWGAPPAEGAAAAVATPKAEAAAALRGKQVKERREREAGGQSPAAEEPTAARATVTTRSRLQRNASLVLKGLPNLYRSELIVAEIMKSHAAAAAAAKAATGRVTSPTSNFTLSSASTGTALPLPGGAAAGKPYFRYCPSYVRLHRGERGAFKNVVFIKYKNREEAEDSKLRLEHLRTGTRLLRVEYKKKVPAAGREGADDAEDAARTEEMLHQLVRDLRVSAEHEGFSYTKSDLSREELKILKQLCQSYGLAFELRDAKVVVRRQLGAAHQMHPTPGSAPARVGSPSPGMRPQPTPTWAPKTPAAFASTNYKSIKHWRDVRTQTKETHSLGIVRPLGPEDVAPFSAGRGRPV